MEIEFGNFKKYIADRGFGFVNRLLVSPKRKEVFCHIRNVKKSNIKPDLVNKLNANIDVSSEYFWFQIENTSKGEQVFSILDPCSFKDYPQSDVSKIAQKIEQIWMDLSVTPPQWLHEASLDILGQSLLEEMITKRELLIQEEERKKELLRKVEQRKRDELLKKIESARKKAEEERIAILAEIAREKEIEENEFRLLVEEIKPLQFTRSKQVSSYIMRNRLGEKYKNISGVVKMELQGNTWDFKGGFPPKIYAQLCQELNLSNEGTYARVVSFDSFNKLNGK